MKDIILAILGSTAFTTIITALVNDYIHRKNTKDNTNKATMNLMGMEVRRSCKEAIRSKGISLDELEQLEECYLEYKNLGGNGFIETLMGKVRNLPIVED